MKLLSSLFVFLLGSSIAMANPNPGPANYTLDASKSTFQWTGKKVTGQHFGGVKFKSGNLVMENNMLKGGTFVVDMTTIDVQDMQGEYADKLTGHLKSDDFFSVDKHQLATLNIVSAESIGNGGYKVKADLIIKGIKQPVEFMSKLTSSGDEVAAWAKFNIDRTKYDIKYGSGSFFDNLGDKAIDNNFQVEVNLVTKMSANPASKMTERKEMKGKKSKK